MSEGPSTIHTYVTYPKIAFCSIQSFERYYQGRRLGVFKALDAFRCMIDKGAFDSWQAKNDSLRTKNVSVCNEQR